MLWSMTSSAGVTASTGPLQRAGVDSTPSVTLRGLQVQPVPMAVAQQNVERHHYLHSPSGGTHLASGAFGSPRPLGVLTLRAGPVDGAFLEKGAEARKPEGASGGGNGSGR
jgi:hypothetical protein